MEQQNTYRNYDYFSVTADNQAVSEIANRYASLGWIFDGQETGVINTRLTFKRERNIKNKAQLDRLQLRIEDCANGVVFLEQSKKKGATTFSCIFGSIASLIFGGGMSLVMYNEPAATFAFIGGIILGVAGGVIAPFAYPIFKKIVKKQTAKINPLIEKKRDELAGLCEEANNLLQL